MTALLQSLDARLGDTSDVEQMRLNFGKQPLAQSICHATYCCESFKRVW